MRWRSAKVMLLVQNKKMTLRFDLNDPEDKRAWEYLQKLNAVSMNKAVLAIINQAEQTSRIQEMIRNTIQEELFAALNQFSFQPIPAEQICDDETADTIMDFLENFT